MITNINDANEALNYIQSENPNFPQEVTERMDADSFNASLYAIENQLNTLYEKIRLLEDLDDFTRTYVESKIKEKEDRLKENLKIIEDVSDLYTDTSSVSILVPLVNDESTIYDRDGSIIPSMKVSDGRLVMDESAVGEVRITAISRHSAWPCYTSSYGNLKEGKPGQSIYYTKNYTSDSLTENVTVDFYEPTEVNYAEIIPVNCEVTAIKGILPDQTEVTINNGYFPEQKLAGLRFTLSAANYDNASISIKENDLNPAKLFGVEDSFQTHWVDKQLIKNLERSMEDADKKYNISILNSIYDTYSRFNEQVKRKNIKVGEN